MMMLHSLKIHTLLLITSSKSCSYLKTDWNVVLDKDIPRTLSYTCHFLGISKIRSLIFYFSGFRTLPIMLILFLSIALNCWRSGRLKGTSSSSKDMDSNTLSIFIFKKLNNHSSAKLCSSCSSEEKTATHESPSQSL
ncbi:unnamed protein product [Brassica oleracea var. botrytis]|uniref:Uncharacterized protein n=2 Tax=Brassica oleracea TaxID=3712 RepID=A0A0D3A8T4_BRAOL|nr:unnamed protein product [Brassica oleracea]